MESNIRVVIIDDEKNARNALKIVLEEFAPQLQLAGMAASAREGMELIKEQEPDVVFVDIQMPFMTGVELMESFGAVRNFEIVFLTAFNNYAQEAFRLKAFDYLLKPIRIPDFLAVVEKLETHLARPAGQGHLDRLKRSFDDRLAIPSADGVEFITIADIVRIEAAGSYAKVFLLDGQVKLFSKNLKAMEELLQDHPFFRAHKSHLINLRHIQKYAPYKDGGTIIMVDNSETILSRRQKEAFVALYKG